MGRVLCVAALALAGVHAEEHGRELNHVITSSTVTFTGGVTANWGTWSSWSGGNVGSAETVVIGASATATVAADQYSHASRITCTGTLRVAQHLCVGPGCDASQFSVAGGDPHIVFAHGGKADFRGSHRDYYAFVTAPGYQFAPYFQEVDFWYASPTGAKQLVHGTFMTRAAWRVRTSANRVLLIKADAMRKAELDVTVVDAMVEGEAPTLDTIKMKPWQRRVFDDVSIETSMLTAKVETPAWAVNVTSKPIYGLVQPLLNGTHVHGHWDVDQRRLDILIHGTYPQPQAHGIVGQSYRDATVRNGKLDVYGIDEFGNTEPSVDSDGMLPTLTTSAQAEGAIDGVHTDYKLPNAWSTDFTYSRFMLAAPATTGPTTKRTASTRDWEGEQGWVGQKRVL